MPEEKPFNEYLIQLIIGLQSTAWMALGKVMNPVTQKTEVNLDLAKDSINTLLMLKEKTKGNLTETEESILSNSMQDLELNFIEVSKGEGNKPKESEKEKKEEPNSVEKNAEEEKSNP